MWKSQRFLGITFIQIGFITLQSVSSLPGDDSTALETVLFPGRRVTRLRPRGPVWTGKGSLRGNRIATGVIVTEQTGAVSIEGNLTALLTVSVNYLKLSFTFCHSTSEE